MYLRKLLLFLLVATTVILEAQINIGTNWYIKKEAGKPSPERVQELRNSTVLFFVRDGEAELVPMLQAQLEKVWTICPIKVLTRQEGEAYIGSHSGSPIATFEISSYRMDTDLGNFFYAYLKLSQSFVNKKGKTVDGTLARVDLQLDVESFKTFLTRSDFKEKVGDYLYTEANIINWTPGLLVKYVQFINDALLGNRSLWALDDLKDKDQLHKLSRQTLYVADNVTIGFSKMKIAEEAVDDPKSLFEGYPYHYELISMADLSDKLLAGGEPFYYMTYVRSNIDKFVSVFRSDTGEPIYVKYNSEGGFKEKDMSRLAKAIK